MVVNTALFAASSAPGGLLLGPPGLLAPPPACPHRTSLALNGVITMRKLTLSLAGAALAAAFAAPVTASAEPAFIGSGADYGQHVAACAEAMGGFTADHNPGMHQGRSGWDGSTCPPG